MTSRVCLGRLGITLLLVATLAGSGCVSMAVGTARGPAHLSRLTVGKSTDADVLRALGEPRGRGVARLAGVDGPRTVWFYDAYSLDSSRIDMNFLVVFLEETRYDGYLWLPSSTLMEKVP